MKHVRAALVSLLVLASSDLLAGDLVRIVRFKLSAGDLASGEAAAEEYKRTTGVDAEYLDAAGWLARGAQILRPTGEGRGLRGRGEAGDPGGGPGPPRSVRRRHRGRRPAPPRGGGPRRRSALLGSGARESEGPIAPFAHPEEHEPREPRR